MHKHTNIERWCHAYGNRLLPIAYGFLTILLLQKMTDAALMRAYLPQDIPQLRYVPVAKAYDDTKVVVSPTLKSSSSSSASIVLRVSRIAENTLLHSGPAVTMSSSSAHTSSVASADFPAFDYAVPPVTRVPNWGAMTSATQWNRTYREMTPEDFVSLPAYDLQKLLVPMADLTKPRNTEEITRKLTYSTHYLSTYDIDAHEFTGTHAGIDIKLALGTPIGSIAGGRVRSVSQNKTLGLHIVIEHRHPEEGAFYSVYAHLASASVKEGDNVRPGNIIGIVGMTGATSGPHLHLQVDRGEPDETLHIPYAPQKAPTSGEAALHAMNPMLFIGRFGGGQ